MINWIKAWWAVYVVGVTTPPQDPEHYLTTKEALELFQAEQEEEWEDDRDAFNY